jgi:hypothetical protein
MPRIRYVKSSNGMFISMRVFGKYKLVLTSDQLSGMIVDAKTGEVVSKLDGNATSPHKAKIKLRQLLESLGVKIEKETRSK